MFSRRLWISHFISAEQANLTESDEVHSLSHQISHPGDLESYVTAYISGRVRDECMCRLAREEGALWHLGWKELWPSDVPLLSGFFLLPTSLFFHFLLICKTPSSKRPFSAYCGVDDGKRISDVALKRFKRLSSVHGAEQLPIPLTIPISFHGNRHTSQVRVLKLTLEFSFPYPYGAPSVQAPLRGPCNLAAMEFAQSSLQPAYFMLSASSQPARYPRCSSWWATKTRHLLVVLPGNIFVDGQVEPLLLP